MMRINASPRDVTLASHQSSHREVCSIPTRCRGSWVRVLFSTVISTLAGNPQTCLVLVSRRTPSKAVQIHYTILIKREGTASVWDSLMEIISMIVQRHAPRGLVNHGANRPAEDTSNYARRLSRRYAVPSVVPLRRFSTDPRQGHLEDKNRPEAFSPAHTAMVPLLGSSNPLSQIDQYDVPDCRYSGLVRTFARRVLRNYGVLYPQGGNGASKFVRVHHHCQHGQTQDQGR